MQFDFNFLREQRLKGRNRQDLIVVATLLEKVSQRCQGFLL